MNDCLTTIRASIRPTTLCWFAVTILAAGATANVLSAEDSTSANDSAAKPSAPLPDESAIRGWVVDLESDSQATRSAAQAALQRAGNAALAQVVAAASSPNPEVRLRCVEILRRHAAGDEAALAQAGQAALGTLAKSAELSVARAAESAIATNARQQAAEEAAQYQDRIVIRGGGAILRLRPMVAPKAFEAMPIGVRSVSVSVVDGKRTIRATSADESVEISDGGDAGIKMTITKKVDGKERKESFAAKNADELKATHAEAFKVYERYAKDGGGRIVADEIRTRLDRIERAAIPAPPKAAAPKEAPPPAEKPKTPPINHVDVPKPTPDATPKPR